MYLNTTYKAFVAKAAAKLMTEMVSKAIDNGSIDLSKSFNDNEHIYDHLNDWWSASDHETVFFDVQDSPTSRIENELSDIADKLEQLVDKI